MTFKEFLLLEDDATSDFFYGLQLLPSDAGDYSLAAQDPGEHSLLQSRWKTEKKQGRQFHGIDWAGFQARDYRSLASRTIPGADDGFWRHKPDNGRGDLEVKRVKNLECIGWGKNSKGGHYLGVPATNQNYGLDLNSMFGDKGTSRPPTLSKDFDKPWRRVYEDVVSYVAVGSRPPINTDMGVPSRLVGPDETGEKTQKRLRIADFGLDPDRQKKRHRKHK